MTNPIVTSILLCYGIFLIVCGIVSVLLIGMKAKTALLSGGMSGTIALIIAYLNYQNFNIAIALGIIWPSILLIVFSWRSAKTLFKVFELIPSKHADLNGKGIAFLIISLMAVVSIIVVMLQIIYSIRMGIGL